MNQKNILLPYASLAAFLRAQLSAAGVAVPADMVIAGVETDGQRVWFQCRSAEWPANKGFGRIPVFYSASPAKRG